LYKRWHNGINKSQVPGSVEQPGLNFGLVRRLVGNDPIFNHIIRNGRNLECNLRKKNTTNNETQRDKEQDKELKSHKEVQQNKRKQMKRSKSKIRQTNAIKCGILPSETTNILTEFNFQRISKNNF
jgi:hypothetical protein